LFSALNVRAEARTYLRSKGKGEGKGKSKSKCKCKCKCKCKSKSKGKSKSKARARVRVRVRAKASADAGVSPLRFASVEMTAYLDAREMQKQIPFGNDRKKGKCKDEYGGPSLRSRMTRVWVA